MLRRHSAAAAIFVLLTIVLTNPLILHVWNAVEDKQDALLNTWIMAWVGHASIADPLNLYEANIYYPYRDTLAFSESLVPQGLLALPVTLATDNPIFGYNLVLLAMFWLNAIAMYLLVLDWTGRRGAGLVAGAVYAFNPFNLGNLAQLQLVSLGWLPLAILYLRRVLAAWRPSQERRHYLRNGAVFALFLILQSLSSIYFALLSCFAVGIYFLWWLWSNSSASEASTIGEDSKGRGRLVFISSRAKTLRPPILAFAASLAVVAVVLIPFLLPYVSVQRDLGFRRSPEESEPFSANLHQFVEVSHENAIYSKFMAPSPVKFVGGYPLDNLFPGLVALLLAGIGIVSSKRRERWLLGVILAFAFIMSLGPRLYLTPDQATTLRLPYLALYTLVPPFQALRAPVRFEALIMFALASLAGLGVCAMTIRKPHADLANQVTDWTIPLILLALCSVEYLSLPAANTVVLPVDSGIPVVYKWLAQQPRGVALELPMIGVDAQDPRHADLSNQYFTAYHWHPTPDGFSGFFAPRAGEVADEMQRLPSSRAISLMQALDVRYLILRRDFAGSIIPETLDSGGHSSGLHLLQDFGDYRAYAVEPSFFSPYKVTERLYLPQPARAGAPYTAYLILGNQQGWPLSVKPTERLDLKAAWSSGTVEVTSPQLPLVTEYVSVIPVRLNAPSVVGRYSLNLHAASGVLAEFDLSGEVQVSTQSANEVVVPLQVKLQSPLGREYAPGAVIRLPLSWQPLGKIDAYYSTSVRVVDASGNVIAAVDREPKGQTFLWKAGTVIDDEFDLTLPISAGAGHYQVELVMYGDGGKTSVLLLDDEYNPQDTVSIGSFDVK